MTRSTRDHDLDDRFHVALDVRVPVGGGSTLSGNVYRPTGPGPVPLLVTMGPYGKDAPMSRTYPEVFAQLRRTVPEVFSGSSGNHLVWEVPDPERWVPWGYAVAHLDARGTGGSPGTWAPMSAQEAVDFSAAIDWLGSRPWCSGRVGVLGVSYHAMAAWRVAAEQPRHLGAVVPWYGAGDAFREAWRHGGILSNAFADTWWYRWVRNQHGSPDVAADQDRRPRSMPVLAPVALEQQREDVPAQTRRHELWDAWAAGQAVDWSRVRVPFLSVAGLSSLGLHLRGNVEGFRQAASTDKWLRVLATRGSGIERFYDDAGTALQRRFLDHHLKGVDNGWDSTPRVVCETSEADGTLSQHAYGSWPPERSRWLRLHLDASAQSLTRQGAAEAGSRRFWSSAGDGVSFRSAPFPAGGLLVGPGSVRLEVSTTARDADLFVSLTLLDADGVVAGLVGKGWLRLSRRFVDERASSTGHPVHPHDRLADVVPGGRYTAEVELWPLSAAIPPGGSLVLTVAGADAVDAGQFRHDDPDDRPSGRFAGWTTLHTSPDRPAVLTLPVSGR